MDNKIYRIAEKRENNTWIKCYETFNETEIYKSLCTDLIAKKLNQTRYIRSIKRVQNYDGTIIKPAPYIGLRSINNVITNTETNN